MTTHCSAKSLRSTHPVRLAICSLIPPTILNRLGIEAPMLDDVEEIGGHQHEGAPSDQTTNRAALSSFTGAIIHMNDEEEERWLALNDHMWCEDAPKDAENDISQWVSDEGALASTSGADERLAVPLSQVAVPLSKVALATLFKSL